MPRIKEEDPRPYRERLEAAGCTFQELSHGTCVSKTGYKSKMITRHDNLARAKRVVEYFEKPLSNASRTV
jgi:hypothetical protein